MSYGTFDYSKNGYRPLMSPSRMEAWLQVNKTPAKLFKDLPPPQDWMAELNKILEKTIDS